jgi:hypothetical protein
MAGESVFEIVSCEPLAKTATVGGVATTGALVRETIQVSAAVRV